MDPNTYGKGPCFETLAQILEEYPDYARQAGSAVHDAYYKVGCIRDIEVASVQREVLTILRKEAMENIHKAKWPGVVRSHTACCVTAIYRERIKTLTDEIRDHISSEARARALARNAS